MCFGYSAVYRAAAERGKSIAGFDRCSVVKLESRSENGPPALQSLILLDINIPGLFSLFLNGFELMTLFFSPFRERIFC